MGSHHASPNGRSLAPRVAASTARESDVNQENGSNVADFAPQQGLQKWHYTQA
jgi:hypothetical protein